MSRTTIDENIKRGMMDIIYEGENKTNCVVSKINSHGKRIMVFDIQKETEIEFSLRDNGDIIKIGEPTENNSSRLVFPILIRRTLEGFFGKRKTIYKR